MGCGLEVLAAGAGAAAQLGNAKRRSSGSANSIVPAFLRPEARDPKASARYPESLAAAGGWA